MVSETVVNFEILETLISHVQFMIVAAKVMHHIDILIQYRFFFVDNKIFMFSNGALTCVNSYLDC